jgi:hypothetical protein
LVTIQDQNDATAYKRFDLDKEISAVFPRKPTVDHHDEIPTVPVSTFIAGDLLQIFLVTMQPLTTNGVTTGLSKEVISQTVEAGLDQMMSTAHATSVKKSKTQVGDGPAMRAEGVMPNGSLIVGEAFEHDGTLFIAAWEGPKGTGLTAQEKGFFDSLSFAPSH